MLDWYKSTNTDAASGYDGHSLMDQMHGPGVYIWPDGAMYEGDYREHKKHGYGVQVLKLLVYEALSYWCMRP